MTNPDGGYRLPEEVDPQRIQFCIEIPNDFHHIIAFWGALDELTWTKNWARDAAHTAIPVTRVWDDVIAKARASFYAGDCLSPELCQDYRPTSARLTWFPESPYFPNADVPSGYTYHPWTVVDNSILGTIISVWGLGYQIGDVYTDFTKLPALSGWDDIITNLGNMPSFTISNLHGKGTVKLHFLNIPQGGRALIQVDNAFNPLNLELVELNKDIISFPQETQTPFVVEVEIKTDGDHELKVSFLPTVDDTFIPIFFGGGFRGFELCGFGVVPMPTDGCCDETNDLLRQMLALWQDGFKIVPIHSGLPPDIAAGDCAPSDFDSDEGESDESILLQREKALCITAERYVKEILIKAALGMFAPQSIADWIASSITSDVPAVLTQIEVVYGDAFGGIAALVSAATGGLDLKIIACRMVNRLKGKNNTFANFMASINPADFTSPSIMLAIALLVKSTNGLMSNFTRFNQALEQAFEEDLSAYECPCEEETPVEPCAIPLDLFFVNGRGLTMENLGEDLWHFTGDPSTFDGTNYIGGVYLKDANGQCFEVAEPLGTETALPMGWSGQSVSYHYVIGCCGTPTHEGVGGFAGGFFTEAYWDRHDESVDTYYRVLCKDTSECEE